MQVSFALLVLRERIVHVLEGAAWCSFLPRTVGEHPLSCAMYMAKGARGVDDCPLRFLFVGEQRG